nr:hypothetical protein HK105_000415 [Polyrhizophydium stewartii]
MLGDPPATASLAEGLRGLVQSILASVARLRSRLEEAEALAQHAQAIATLALSLPEAAGDETLPSLLVDVGPTLNDIGRFLAETASKNVVQQTLNARKTRTAIKDFEARLAKLELEETIALTHCSEIQSNQLESLPASIGGLAKLQHL